MQQPQEIVWNTITDSAKTKFDYQAFEKIFSETGNNHLAENVLFLTIIGHAAGHPTQKIVADINRELALLAIGFLEEDLQHFVTEKKIELKHEIRAADIAIALFQRGLKSPGVLVQVRSILQEPTKAT